MDKLNLPEDYQTVMPYLIIENALNFFAFTKTVFRAEEKARHLNPDGSLMHGEIMIGNSTIMFGNASAQWPVQNAGLYINVADVDETFHKAVDNGAKIIRDITNEEYGRSGGVIDPFGNTWWITAVL